MSMESPPYQVVLLHRLELPSRLAEAFAAASPEPPLLLLARALASSHVWADGPPVTFVARPLPTPALAAIGRFGEADRARLQALHGHLHTVLRRTVYLDHRQAEAACERLAERLKSRFSSEEIARMRFVGIPRGGMIVLGMLAYALGLSRRQLVTDDDATSFDGPLVVVDDCVLSGLRLSQFMEGRKEQEFVVATLYSHPDLRDALPAHLPGLVGVVSAFDLVDHAPEALGVEYTAWRERWDARNAGRAPWIGQPDHICFPWGEPETSSWNPVTDREEVGWHMIPPELCLKHRHRTDTGRMTTQLQESGGGIFRPSDGVIVGDIGGVVVIGDLITLTTRALDGVGAAMWRALIASEDEEAAVTALSATYDVDAERLRADVGTFVSMLLANGILERVDA